MAAEPEYAPLTVVAESAISTAQGASWLKMNGELVVLVDGMPDFGACKAETAQRLATNMAFDVRASSALKAW